jgi:hypothetical protein
VIPERSFAQVAEINPRCSTRPLRSFRSLWWGSTRTCSFEVERHYSRWERRLTREIIPGRYVLNGLMHWMTVTQIS